MSAAPSLRQPSRHQCAAVLAVAYGAMLAWSWGTWPDATVDFGRELYLTWRISEGEVLYRDLPYFDGPLSLLLNALWVRVAGMSLLAIVLRNLVLVALLTAGLFLLLERLADRAAALAGGIVLLTTFAFARLLDVGNFNYVTPYTHLVPDGLALAVAALLAMTRVLDGQARWGLAVGAALGASFVGKADMFAALAAAVVGGGAAAWWAAPDRRPELRAAMRWAVPMVFVAPMLVFLWFLRALPPAEALRAVLGSWPHLLGEVSALPFYRGVLGIDRPGENLALLAVTSAAWALLGGVVYAGCRWLRVPPAREALTAIVLFLAPLVLFSPFPWTEAFRPLPLAVGLMAAGVLAGLRRVRGTAEAPLAAMRLAFLLWALVLLSKVALNAKLRHYGFGLAMPGMLALAALLVWWLPNLLPGAVLPASCRRALGGGILAAVILAHLLVSAYWFGELRAPVGSGPDRFRAQPAVAAPLNEAVAWLARERPGATLASYPDGAMLNYLSRRRNPSGQTLAVPTAVALLGEEAIIASLEAAPPDLIAIVFKDTSDEGARDFGVDYAAGLATWIRAHYAGVVQFVPPAGSDPEFRIVILERRAPSPGGRDALTPKP